MEDQIKVVEVLLGSNLVSYHIASRPLETPVRGVALVKKYGAYYVDTFCVENNHMTIELSKKMNAEYAMDLCRDCNSFSCCYYFNDKGDLVPKHIGPGCR